VAVAYFKVLIKEFAKELTKIKKDIMRLVFRFETEIRDTRIQSRDSAILPSRAFRTAEGSVAYLYLSVQTFDLD
jgi:hypothetical protein